MLLDSSRRKGKSKMKLLRTIAGYLALWRYKRGWMEQLKACDSEQRPARGQAGVGEA
jgi:hypothetical protein